MAARTKGAHICLSSILLLAGLTWAMAAGEAEISVQQESVMTASFYVSPQGDDLWSGTLPEPNAEGDDGPFRTITRAQRAVRAHKAQGPLAEPLRIELRGGAYFLDAPLVFTDEDSGAPSSGERRGPEVECPVVYAAFPGEKPLVSGGRRLAGWREEQVNGRTAWALSLPEVPRGEWYFRQLFVNGSRRGRPRLPKQGFYRIAQATDARFGDDWGATIQHGSDRFIYADGDIHPWRNLHDVEITVLALWEALHLKLAALDESKHLAIFDRNSERRMTDDFKEQGAPYYVENVFEALEEPGQWYLDRPTGTLYYLPLPGEDVDTAEVIAPYLPELMRLEGGADAVRCLRFEGLTFAHTEWPLPPDMASTYQGSTKAPAAVTLRSAQRIRFDGCTFEHLGTHALHLVDACWAVAVSGCALQDLGAGAVMIRDNCPRNTIEDCEISDIGRLFHNSAAIMIGQSSGNKVVHNHIHHGPWAGISVGWSWGYGEGSAYGNIIEYNHIHDLGIGDMLSDIGAIYTLGVSPGTRLRYNLIHDIRRRGYGGWGIYLDEGSTDILVEYNLVYRAQSSGFHEHYGRDNLVRNNIFALNGERQIERTRREAHRAFIFRQNIVYADGRPILTDQEWGPENAEFARNLYYDASGAAPDFASETFREWQASGMDAGSVVADPLFLDPQAGGFRLRPGSPAFALGFKEFDLSAVGPRR